MAGFIKAESVATVKQAANIEQIISEHVTLRPAGSGSLVGLCPFHDEKTPSFNVRPAIGRYHCFGCGESGDAISFLRDIEHLTFPEAVEVLAAKTGIALEYEDGPRKGPSLSNRMRLIEAHRVAEVFFAENLANSPEAQKGREFLAERQFTPENAQTFGMGFSPRGFHVLADHLRAQGFTDDEGIAAGLVGRSARGMYDRFRGRLMWPIRNNANDTIGFGARRIFDDDTMPAKYLNTPETAIYKKSTVLYGLDLAKKSIASSRTCVVVEGYTDVMAAHLAGVTTAVATCGTAFGVEHMRLIRRLTRDEVSANPARVVFTFDGDAAGKKAALATFANDQEWASQSFVAVVQDGMDPCDLRIKEGDAALGELIEKAIPMFDFAVRTKLAEFDVSYPAGRVRAAAAIAPLILAIRDTALHPEYIRIAAGRIGIEMGQMRQALLQVRRNGPPQRSGARAGGRFAQRSASGRPPEAARSHPASQSGVNSDADSSPHSSIDTATGAGGESGEWAQLPQVTMPDPRDPIARFEAQVLQVALQHPESLPRDFILDPMYFTQEAFALIATAIISVGLPAQASADSVESVQAMVPEEVRSLVTSLAVSPIAFSASVRAGGDGAEVRDEQKTNYARYTYVNSLALGLQRRYLERSISEHISQLQRVDPYDELAEEKSQQISQEIARLQKQLADLR